MEGEGGYLSNMRSSRPSDRICRRSIPRDVTLREKAPVYLANHTSGRGGQFPTAVFIGSRQRENAAGMAKNDGKMGKSSRPITRAGTLSLPVLLHALLQSFIPFFPLLSYCSPLQRRRLGKLNFTRPETPARACTRFTRIISKVSLLLAEEFNLQATSYSCNWRC